MFGIGGGEFLFIIIVVLMLFGSDKIPEMARALGKGMAQLRNATNEVKSEINRNMQENGLDRNSLTGGITEEIDKAKQGFGKMANEVQADASVKNELDQIRENFAKMNTDLNPDAREFNPDLPELAHQTPELPEIKPDIEPLPDSPDGPIKRQS
jgi:sec-independent protein translocase protein TatA